MNKQAFDKKRQYIIDTLCDSNPDMAREDIDRDVRRMSAAEVMENYKVLKDCEF